MILTAHQPTYLPWLGTFHKMACADKYVIFDIAQYQHKEWDNRNKIKTKDGPLWLTVPVHAPNHLETTLQDVTVDGFHWQRKHLRSIELAYSKAPYFKEYFEQLKGVYEYKYRTPTPLVDVNVNIMWQVAILLGVHKERYDIEFASDHNFVGQGSDLVLDMCLKLGATSYIFGGEGRNYCNVEKFLEAGVTPIFQDYQHPVYNQLHGPFILNMSAIDLLFNEGPKAKEILLGQTIQLQNARNVSPH